MPHVIVTTNAPTRKSRRALDPLLDEQVDALVLDDDRYAEEFTSRLASALADAEEATVEGEF
jgi:hypothetical protein